MIASPRLVCAAAVTLAGLGGASLAGIAADRARVGAVARPVAPPSDDAMGDLTWRPLGPLRTGGRLNAIAVATSDPVQRSGLTIYTSGTGGIFRTTNDGATWDP